MCVSICIASLRICYQVPATLSFVQSPSFLLQSKLLQGHILDSSFLIAVKIHCAVMEEAAILRPFLVDMRILFQTEDDDDVLMLLLVIYRH